MGACGRMSGNGYLNRYNMFMSQAFDRITVNSDIMNGQPTIRGMRLTVKRVLEAVSMYPDRKDLFREYPDIEEEDIKQALEYAATYLEDKNIHLRAA